MTTRDPSKPFHSTPLFSARVNAKMGSNLPKEFQKNYTWDAIVFSDGATYVSSIASVSRARTRD